MLSIRAHFTHHSGFRAISDSTFEMVSKVGRAEDVAVVRKILPASFDGASRTAESETVRHQGLNNT